MKLLQNTKHKLSFSYGLLLIFSFLSFNSCDEVEDGLEGKGTTWKLVWSDEFNDAGALNDANWTYDLGHGIDGWGNNELQNYTSEAENVRVEDGLLKLVAINNTPSTSARVKTQGRFSQTYGRFEARIKVPYGQGIWPAFWLLGNNIDTVGWPKCGEIDIMELKGQEPEIVNGSLHGPGNFGANPITRSFSQEQVRFDADFHVYAIEWGVDYIDYFVDDNVYQHITPNDVGEWVFNQPFFIVLNVAIGGNYVGFPTIYTPFPQTMEVDYVRVYKEIN